jgi:MFS family permease
MADSPPPDKVAADAGALHVAGLSITRPRGNVPTVIDHTKIRPGQRRALIMALMTSTFMAAMEISVIATAMPGIITALGGFELFSWAFSMYLLTQAVMTPVYGRLADLFGRKRTYIGACLTFLIGSLLCGLAWSMPSLIAFRAMQGLGAAGMAPIASTIMADISAPKQRPKAVGWISSIYGVAAVVGPLVGAALVRFGWPWVFWINLPFGVVAVGMVAHFLREELTPARHGVDMPGAGLLLVGAGALMLVLTQHATLSPTWIVACGVAGVMALGALAWHQARAAEPMIPHYFWRNRMILTGVAYGAMIGTWSIAFSAFLPTFVQGVRGGTPLEGGLSLAWMSLTWTLGSLVAGRAVARIGFWQTAFAGGVMAVAGSAILATLSADQNYWWLRIGSIISGFGVGAANLTFTVSIQSSVPWGDRGRATSFYFFCRILGQALGAAALGGLLNAGLGTVSGADPMEVLVDPARRGLLEPAVLRGLTAMLDGALRGVWIAMLGVAVVMLVLTALQPRQVRVAVDLA